MHLDVYACLERILCQGGDDVAVGQEVPSEVAGLNGEDIDEDADEGEDVGALKGEVVFHECVLVFFFSVR